MCSKKFKIKYISRYYELDTAYCEGNNTEDYDASDMMTYMQIRKWGSEPTKLKTGENYTNDIFHNLVQNMQLKSTYDRILVYKAR